MGDVISAVSDDYDEYIALCKSMGINPKEFMSWSYDDSDAVKLVKAGKHTLEQAYMEISLENQRRELLSNLEQSRRLIDEAINSIKKGNNEKA
jgi:hypothetical protein